MSLLLCLLAWNLFHLDEVHTYACENKQFLKYDGGKTKVCIGKESQPSAYESTCSQAGAVLFQRRMSDEMFQDIGNKLQMTASLLRLFIGMEKERSFPVKWKYNRDGGSVEETKYEFWAKKRDSKDCAVMAAGYDFEVYTRDCMQASLALCEKEEPPCYDSSMFYAEYYGHCLSKSNQQADYSSVESFCLGGYIFPVKDRATIKSANAALYYDYLVYAGLKKKDGKWVYGSGEEESMDRFAGGKAGEMECGYYGFGAKNESLEIFTASCESQFRPLCVLPH